MADLLREKSIPHESAATQAAAFWMENGLECYLKQPLFFGCRYYYVDRERTSAQSLDAWQRCLKLSPDNRDALLCEALVFAQADPGHPEKARAQFQTVLRDLADRPVKADVFSELGDCYLDAGQFGDALGFYMQSCDAYTLPKIVNHRGLRGLGGW
jgi:tetratricopeptide (TPR) repeat protein